MVNTLNIILNKVPSDAKKFIERLKTVRNTLDALEEEASTECTKFSEDVKHWAEFQTGVKVNMIQCTINRQA